MIRQIVWSADTLALPPDPSLLKWDLPVVTGFRNGIPSRRREGLLKRPLPLFPNRGSRSSVGKAKVDTRGTISLRRRGWNSSNTTSSQSHATEKMCPERRRHSQTTPPRTTRCPGIPIPRGITPLSPAQSCSLHPTSFAASPFPEPYTPKTSLSQTPSPPERSLRKFPTNSSAKTAKSTTSGLFKPKSSRPSWRKRRRLLELPKTLPHPSRISEKAESEKKKKIERATSPSEFVPARLYVQPHTRYGQAYRQRQGG